MLRTTLPLTVVFLHSNRPYPGSALLKNTLETIKNDHLLSKQIRVICNDDPNCRSHMKYNQNGLRVPETPTFLLKMGSGETRLYNLFSREEVFQQIRSIASVPESSVPESSVPAGPVSGKKIPWGLESFPEDGSGITLKIKDGENLRFVGTPGILHDVTMANSRWEPLNRLIPRTHNLDKVFEVTPELKRVTYLICSVGDHHEIMRLKLVRENDSIAQILHGIGDRDLKYTSSKGDVSDDSPAFNIRKVTLRTKPQIVTLEDGTRVKIGSKPVQIENNQTA